jgi:alkylation response protein AidB-like acyl-CoA dehydrogenase
MQPLTAPGRPRATRGRWIWILSGTLTIATISAFGGWAVVRASNPPNGPLPIFVVPTRIVTVTQPVTALNVQSYGAPIKVTTAPGPVRIAESIMFSDADGPPAVTDAD